MGLFFNKKKFDITPKTEELKYLVTNYSGHNGVVKINGKLIVPEGFEFVLGKNGKVTDIFKTGEYFFSFSNLPYSCRRYKIDKMEGGKQKDKFSFDQYFVDKNLRGGQFKTYRKVEMGTRAYGIFKTGVTGVYSYKVLNTRELMQSLLNEFDYIKSGEAEGIIENWVNDLIVETLEKNNFMLDDIIVNAPIITEKLKQAVGKLFTIAGLELCDLRITKYKLPKKYQEQSDLNIAKQNCKKVEDNSENVENNVETEEQNLIENSSDISDENNLEQEQNKSKIEYVPFGNFVIEESKSIDQETIKKEEQKPKERTFVDLSLNKLYDNEKEKTKRCTRCGTENNIDADHCILCGEKFFDDKGEDL